MRLRRVGLHDFELVSGARIGGLSLEGVVDTRPLAPLVDDGGDPGVICDLSVSFGATCIPCGSDGEAYCLPFREDRPSSGADTRASGSGRIEYADAVVRSLAF